MRGAWRTDRARLAREFKEPLRTIESAFFLRYCVIGTDRLLLMVRRRVADLWRHATTDVNGMTYIGNY